MSKKVTPAYVDPLGAVMSGFDGNAIACEGTTVPANGTAGFAPGCLFFKRSGTVGAAIYKNDGTALSCAFVAWAGGA